MKITKINNKSIINVLKGEIKPELINTLLNRFEEVISEYLLENYEVVLIKVGKLVEDFYQILDYIMRKKIASKPNLPKIRERMEKAVNNQKISPFLRFLVGDSLQIAYRFRNKRDGAHSVDFIANKIDSQYVINIIKWCLAELIREFSNLSLEECLKLIEPVIEEPVAHIQQFGDDFLVLHHLSASNEILTLLFYSIDRKIEDKKLKTSIKNQSQSNIATSLNNLKKKRYIFQKNGFYHITNLGEKHIINILKNI